MKTMLMDEMIDMSDVEACNEALLDSVIAKELAKRNCRINELRNCLQS